MTPIDQYVTRALDLVDMERRTELEEARRLRETLSAAELERDGLALLRLRVVDASTDLGGRTVLRLERTTGGDLPAHRFQPGDIAVLRAARSEGRRTAERGEEVTGVVYRLARSAVIVALDEEPEGDLPDLLRLDRAANDVTYRRLRDSLETLRRYGHGPAARLRAALFGVRDVRPLAPARRFEVLDTALDPSQRDAVASALEAPDIGLIHGPPGTGKTTAVVELIRQAVERRERVLACAPSNIAVDNLAERLVAHGVRIVRLGHPARLLPSVVEHSLEALVEGAEGTRVAATVRRELEDRARRMRRARERGERRRLREEARDLRRELRDTERGVVRHLVDGAEVVLATCVGAAAPELVRVTFDLVVIDEAAQAVEPACWIPLLRGRRAVLAGDHRQLPPTIRSPEAARQGLGTTLFDRLVREHGEAIARMLTTQYRMHETIMRWASEELYEGRLEAHASVRTHLLADLAGVAATGDTRIPFLLIDTAGRGFEESRQEHGESRANEGEAGLVATHVDRLTGAGVPPADIAVITPYNAQVELLRRQLGERYPDLEIDSVDGFQGREKEAVVISLVRSNEDGEVGFLADDRRTNVAVTRARRHVAIVGDSATVARHPLLGRLVEYAQEHGEYRSAWEYA